MALIDHGLGLSWRLIDCAMATVPLTLPSVHEQLRCLLTVRLAAAALGQALVRLELPLLSEAKEGPQWRLLVAGAWVQSRMSGP